MNKLNRLSHMPQMVLNLLLTKNLTKLFHIQNIQGQNGKQNALEQ